MLGGPEFFVTEVLELMNRKELASYFERGEAPSWISDNYIELRQQRCRNAMLGTDGPERVFARANTSASAGQYVYALVLYDELAMGFPEQLQFTMGKIVLLEQLGKTQAAVKMISTVDDKATKDNVAGQILEGHLSYLKKATEKESSPVRKALGSLNYTAYIGGSLSKDLYSIDGRVGICTSKQYSLSANVGMAICNKQPSFSFGVSAYKTFGLFMVGIGLNNRIANKNFLFTISPSGGISIPDPDGSGSYDIIANVQLPLTQGSSATFSLSFGRTFYFHPKKKRL